MFSGETSTGFKFSIDERIKDDWRLVKAIADAESDEPTVRISGTCNLVLLLLGSEGEKALQKHIAARNDGFVPMEEVNKEIASMLSSIKEIKK